MSTLEKAAETQKGALDAPEESNHQNERFQKNFIIYSILIGITAIAFLFFACTKYYITPSEGFADQLAELIAYAFWIGVGLALLWRTIPRNRKRTAVLCSCLIISIIAVYKSANLLRAASSVRNTFDRFSSILTDLSGGQHLRNEKIDETKYGEMTELVTLMTDWACDVQRDTDKMYSELEACNLGAIYNYNVLTQPKLLSKCRVNYETAETVIKQYEDQAIKRFDEFMTRVKSSNLPEEQKKRLLSVVDRTKDENLEGVLDVLRIRKRCVSAGIKLLNFMEEKQATCKYQGNNIIFQSQEDANAFNLYLGNLTRLSEEESKWIEKTQREAETKAKEIEQLSKSLR